MPTKWLQERVNGSKNELGIGFEGPGVVGRGGWAFIVAMSHASLGLRGSGVWGVGFSVA